LDTLLSPVFGGGKEAATLPFDIFWPGSLCLIVSENQRFGKSAANGEHRVRLVDVDWTRVLL
jgi:hypothetical protein